MKRRIAVTAAVMMACSLMAMPAMADEAEVNVTFVSLMQGGAAWGMAEKGFNDACEELGWTGQFLAPATPNDTMAMLEYIENAITNGANALIGPFIDPDVFGSALTDARSKGIYVAGTNITLGEELMDFWIGTDPVGMGTTQAMTLAELVGDEECTVVYMQTNSTATTQNQQYEAFCKYLEDYENISVFGQEYCNSDEVYAAETISNLVKANPEINACVAADGNGCIGIANYVDESGNADDFFAVGIDDSADILHYVTSGALDCTIAQDFYTMGYESCKMVKRLMDGEELPYDNDSGSVVIKAEDVETYAADKGIEL